MAIEEILDLEQLEVNIYRGGVFSPESGFLQRTFGGHVAGQSLVSAVRTVDPKHQVHSLHGYFLRPGDPHEPPVRQVDDGEPLAEQPLFAHRVAVVGGAPGVGALPRHRPGTVEPRAGRRGVRRGREGIH